MEVSYELLWKLCNGFLLSFLVSGLVSLILYCPNSTHDDFSEQNMVKSSIHGGKKMKKRVKFFVQVDEHGLAKDIEVDGVNRYMGVEESVEKDEILSGGSGDDGVGLVDLCEKGGIFVGFDGRVVKGCVGVDSCLSGDVVDGQRERSSTNSCLELASGENEADKMVGYGVDVSMCSDELVDDQRERNSMSLSVELASRGDEDGKIVGCDVDVRLCSDELVADHRERNFTNWSNVCDDERIGKKARSNVDSKERTCDVFVEGMLNDEEEWEGIERSDLAKEFARAKCFVEKDDKGRRLVMAGGNDLIMELYGLEKVAMEGPCHEPQPMALKFAARAKWNAWQKLGNMSPEEAMEKYIFVISQNVPEWMEDHSYVVSKSHSVEEKVDRLADSQISPSLDQRFVNLRTLKVSDLMDASTSMDQVNSGLTME